MSTTIENANEASKLIDKERAKELPRRQSLYLKELKTFLGNFCISCYKNKKRDAGCSICQGSGQSRAPKFTDIVLNDSWGLRQEVYNYQDIIRKSFTHIFCVGGKVLFENKEAECFHSDENRVLIKVDGVYKIVSAHELVELNYLDDAYPKFTVGSGAQKRYAKALRCQVMYTEATQEDKDFFESTKDSKLVIAKYKDDKRIKALPYSKIFKSLL